MVRSTVFWRVKSFLTLLAAALAACAQLAPPPAAPPERPGRLLGEVEIRFEQGPSGTLQASAVSTQGTFVGDLTLRNLSKGLIDKDGVRYLYATFEVTNPLSTSLDNLTFYALNRPDALGGTAVHQLRAMNNSTISDATLARSILPTHRMDDERGTLQVKASEADFQAFSASEVSAVQSQGTLTADGRTVLEYGFVARNSAGKRPVAGNGKAFVTFAVKYPYDPSSTKTYPFSFTLAFAAVDESVTRVTRSAEEDAASVSDACSRAAALGASEVVAIGSVPSAVPSGCTVRGFEDVKVAIPSSAGPAIYLLSGAQADTEVTVNIRDSNVVTSPYNWRKGADFIETNNPGAYLKLGFTGSYVKASFDTSAYDALGASSGNYPKVRVTVDGVSKDIQLTSGSPLVTLASGLSTGNHTLELGFVSTLNSYDRWNTPANVVRITEFRLSPGGGTFAPGLRAKRMILFADSHGEGVRINNGNSNPTGNDALKAFSAQIAANFGAELGNVSFGGQGWTVKGSGNVAPVYNSSDSLKGWGRYSGNNSRMPLEPAPDYVVMIHGHNDHNANVSDSTVSARAAAWLSDVRASAPNADIFLVVPFKGFKRAALASAYSSYTSGNPDDTKAHFIDLGAEAESIMVNNSHDGGVHMNATGHVLMSNLLTKAMQGALSNLSNRLTLSTILQQTRLNGSLTSIQDDPDTPDANWMVATSTTATVSLNGNFPPAPAPLKQGKNLQEFRVLVRKTPGSGTPNVRLQVMKASDGSSVLIGKYIPVTSETGQIVTLTWDAALLGSSDAGIRIISQLGANGENIDLGAVEWNAALGTD